MIVHFHKHISHFYNLFSVVWTGVIWSLSSPTTVQNKYGNCLLMTNVHMCLVFLCMNAKIHRYKWVKIILVIILDGYSFPHRKGTPILLYCWGRRGRLFIITNTTFLDTNIHFYKKTVESWHHNGWGEGISWLPHWSLPSMKASKCFLVNPFACNI